MMKKGLPKVKNKRGFYKMYRKVTDETILSQLRQINNFSPQQSNKAIWEELHPLDDVKYVLLAYLNTEKRMNRISPFLRTRIKKDINRLLDGITSIADFPPSTTYIIKVFDTDRLIRYIINEKKALANIDLSSNAEKAEELVNVLNHLSQEVGTVNLSEIVGAPFKGERIISVADPNEFISNGKILKAYFESCLDSHLNAVPRFLFQSPEWVKNVGLNSDYTYTAYNTGNTGGLQQDEIVGSGRQDFTITDGHVTTHAIAQNKLLRAETAAHKSSYLAEISRDLVATQGFSVPGYNIFTLLNHDVKKVGISTSTPGTNITYIGVFGGIDNPSSGLPKLGQAAEWAMHKALSEKCQVTEGSNLSRKVELDSLMNEVQTTSYRSSRITTIPSTLQLNNNIIEKVGELINSTNNPLTFLLGVLRFYATFKSENTE